MKRMFCFVLLCLIYLFNVAADDTEIMAITENNQRVVLKSDMTWEFIQEKTFEIDIVSFDVQLYPENYGENRYSDEMVLELLIRNNSQKIIRGYRLFLDASNDFGDFLDTLQLTVGATRLASGAEHSVYFTWKDNQFINDETYDKLAHYSVENLNLNLTNAIVLYVDEDSN